MKKSGCGVVGFCFVIVMFGIYVAKGQGWEKTEVISSVDFKVSRISDVADLLSRAFQIPVCVEESRWFAREGDSEERGKEFEAKRKAGYEIVATNSSIETILNQFVQRYAEYQWTFYRKNRVVNLFPRNIPAADWNVNHVNITSQSIEGLMITADVIGLRDRGIRFQPGRGNLSWVKTMSITVKGDNECVRNLLNEISCQLPEPRYWVIRELKRPGIPWEGARCEQFYDLQFLPYVKKSEALVDETGGVKQSVHK